MRQLKCVLWTMTMGFAVVAGFGGNPNPGAWAAEQDKDDSEDDQQMPETK